MSPTDHLLSFFSPHASLPAAVSSLMPPSFLFFFFSVGRMAWPCVPSSTDTDPTSLTTPNWERWPILLYFPLYFQPLYWTLINAVFLCLFTFIIEALLEIFFPVNWLLKRTQKDNPSQYCTCRSQAWLRVLIRIFAKIASLKVGCDTTELKTALLFARQNPAKTLKLKHFLMRFISRLQNTHQNCRGWRASPCSLLCVTLIVCFFRTTPSVTWTPPSRWLRSTWTSRRCSTLKVRPRDVNVTEQCRKRVLSCYADAHGDELSCSEMHDGRHGGSGLLGKFNHLHWKNECILNHFKCIYSGTSGSDLGNMTAL